MTHKVVFTDHNGVTWHRYGGRYTDENGGTFAIDIWAKDDADARRRADAVRNSFRIDGRICAIVDASGDEVLADSNVPELGDASLH